ncbi:Hypothetical predicted protein [Paramuricea clavata]|uniref:Uncharacterized protein n=1 Tax=Paramuricea clavata TaxID=317549 RepID=A0A6S7IL63_PARCT|nr:Hypothetical predicted protein [Paramuricea clavata]
MSKTQKSQENVSTAIIKEWDGATGGVWVAGIPIIPGTMLKLAEHNYDHFAPQAKTAYVVGHGYAIERAREAGRSEENLREKLLFEAYSIDGYACHFLTDAFATGHMRTPRAALPMKVTPAVIGHLLCKYMHDEDSKFGIRVTNVRGNTLVAYGGGRLMEEADKVIILYNSWILYVKPMLNVAFLLHAGHR